MDTLDPSTTLSIGAAIATGMAILQAFLAIPSCTVPLMVLLLSCVLVGLAVVSGNIDRDPLTIAVQVVSQTASTMGLREGLVAALPRASSLPTVINKSAGMK